MPGFVVAMEDPRAPDVKALLEVHLEFANDHSPPEDVHALDIPGLLANDISFFGIREEGALLAVGALKHLDPSHAELKSIHTARVARGRGVGRTMVEYLVGVARDRGYSRVSLETGSMPAFAPSRALYASAGFELCEPFAGYRPSPHSVCMTLYLNT